MSENRGELSRKAGAMNGDLAHGANCLANSGLSGSGLLESSETTFDEALGTLDLYATVSKQTAMPDKTAKAA
ncbi:MAG: hypothetical protein ACXWO1_10785, partial [Isosphaeraceae bacterium]